MVPLLGWIALAGALGSLSRFGLSRLVQGVCGDFPLHTFVVNALGCLLFGVVHGYAHGRWSAVAETAVLVGFFGAFTTFSSFAFDVVQLAEARRLGAFVFDLVGQNLVGITALAVGLWLGGRLR